MSEVHAAVGSGSISSATGLFKNLPKLIQVVLFILLAIVSAAAGTLDDWVRVVLAVLFAGVALCLLAEVREGIAAHRAAKEAP